MSEDSKTLTWIYFYGLFGLALGVAVGLAHAGVPVPLIAVIAYPIGWGMHRIARRDLPKGKR